MIPLQAEYKYVAQTTDPKYKMHSNFYKMQYIFSFFFFKYKIVFVMDNQSFEEVKYVFILVSLGIKQLK